MHKTGAESPPNARLGTLPILRDMHAYHNHLFGPKQATTFALISACDQHTATSFCLPVALYDGGLSQFETEKAIDFAQRSFLDHGCRLMFLASHGEKVVRPWQSRALLAVLRARWALDFSRDSD